MIRTFFSKPEVPKEIPVEMQEVIDTLKNSANQEECLRRAYEIMTDRFRGGRMLIFLRPFQIFISNARKVWANPGLTHCHNANYLLRTLLVRSGFFDNEDIKNKWTLIWYISPHQYVQVTLNTGKKVNVDMWAKVYGTKFGDYAHGFH